MQRTDEAPWTNPTMNVVSYVNPKRDDVRLRVEFRKHRRRILEFVVQIEFLRDDEWVPVVRYDTAHGVAHRDSYAADRSVSRHEPLPETDFNRALTLAEKECNRHWRKWVGRFRRLRS